MEQMYVRMYMYVQQSCTRHTYVAEEAMDVVVDPTKSSVHTYSVPIVIRCR